MTLGETGRHGANPAPAAPVGTASAFLWAFGVADGVAEPLTDETLQTRGARGSGWTWVHLPLSDQRARGFIERDPELPEAARELILGAEPRVQLQFSGDWAFGVLPDLKRDLDGRAQGVGRLQFALSDRRLITARRHALQCVDSLRRKVAGAAAPATPSEAWLDLVEVFIDTAERSLQDLAEAVDRFEDRLLGDDDEAVEGLALGPLRRELSRQQRDYLALRSALARATSPRAAHRLTLIAEHLPRLVHEVEDLDRESRGLQDRARLLHEEIDTRIAAGANRSMRTLTVMSTLLIPPTLIVGAFGMNFSDIPFADGRFGFVTASLLCVAVVAGAYALLRRWRILS